jgi:hypothetical protein
MKMKLRFMFEVIVTIVILIFPATLVGLGAVGLGYIINIKELHFLLQGLFSISVVTSLLISFCVGVWLLVKLG